MRPQGRLLARSSRARRRDDLCVAAAPIVYACRAQGENNDPYGLLALMVAGVALRRLGGFRASPAARQRGQPLHLPSCR